GDSRGRASGRNRSLRHQAFEPGRRAGPEREALQPARRHVRDTLRAHLAGPVPVGVDHVTAAQRGDRGEPHDPVVEQLESGRVQLRVEHEPAGLVVRQQLHHFQPHGRLHRGGLLDGRVRPGEPQLPREVLRLRADPGRPDGARRGARPAAVPGVPRHRPAGDLLGGHPALGRPPRGPVRLPLLHQGHPGGPHRGRPARRCQLVADLLPDRHAAVPAGDLRGGDPDVHHVLERLPLAAAGAHADQVPDHPGRAQQPGRGFSDPVLRDDGLRRPRHPAAARRLPGPPAPDRPRGCQHRHQV
ncbi:MAG: hypothetical protein AVDCRST_MAG83-1930, partial [uncultured Arthrobacter sp.]